MCHSEAYGYHMESITAQTLSLQLTLRRHLVCFWVGSVFSTGAAPVRCAGEEGCQIQVKVSQLGFFFSPFFIKTRWLKLIWLYGAMIKSWYVSIGLFLDFLWYHGNLMRPDTGKWNFLFFSSTPCLPHGVFFCCFFFPWRDHKILPSFLGLIYIANTLVHLKWLKINK